MDVVSGDRRGGVSEEAPLELKAGQYSLTSAMTFCGSRCGRSCAVSAELTRLAMVTCRCAGGALLLPPGRIAIAVRAGEAGGVTKESAGGKLCEDVLS